MRPSRPTAPPPRLERPRLATVLWAAVLVAVVIGCLVVLQPVGLVGRRPRLFFVATVALALGAAHLTARRVGRDDVPPRGAGSAAHALRAATAVLLVGFGAIAVRSASGVEEREVGQLVAESRLLLGRASRDVPPSPARAHLGWLWIGSGVLLGVSTLWPSRSSAA